MKEINGYLSSGSRPVYGTAFLPDSLPAQAALLIIDPIGEEKRAAYRMLVRLARSLAEKQIASFKFDLSGTGDSAGRHQDATWEDWLEDARLALQCIGEYAQTDNTVVCGARAGALLAAQTALDCQAKRLVLAEPILSGEEFLRDMERRQTIKNMAAGITESEDAQSRWDKGLNVDFAGFNFNPKLAQGLKKVSLVELIEKLRPACVVKAIRVSASKKLPPAWSSFAEDTVIVQDKPFWGQLDYYESDFVNDAITAALQ